jgi:hypothetical protein
MMGRALDLLAVFRPVDWVQRGHMYTSEKGDVRLVVTTEIVRHDSLISSASCSVRSTQIKWYLCLAVSCGMENA